MRIICTIMAMSQKYALAPVSPKSSAVSNTPLPWPCQRNERPIHHHVCAPKARVGRLLPSSSGAGRLVEQEVIASEA